ncbi:MAG: phospholipase D family protein [Anaerolineales bacterium]|nr:phospholipase D family protein [Anaerolineales bacterium]
MEILPLIQRHDSPKEGTIQGVMEGYVHRNNYNCVQVAMAYASIAGVRTFLDVFANNKIEKSQWLIGLDDAITQPGAIKLLLGLENSEVRIVKLFEDGARFHPKVARFRSLNRMVGELLVMGSANLTNRALAGNSEAVVFIESKNPEEKNMFSKIWADLWLQGHTPKRHELSEYERVFKLASNSRKVLRKKIQDKPLKQNRPIKILENDNAELDPSHARVCWIECGNVTAMGRELEFKAEQGLFFGLEPTGGHERIFRFRVSNGLTINLKMKYQQNHMWRLQMNNNVPEVQRGLRPIASNGALGRSDEVAIFTRTKEADRFALSFVKLNSREFAKIKKASLQSGTVGQTSARSYGWL